MKQKVSAFALLVAFIGPMLVTYLVIHHKRYRVRREVKHQIMDGIPKEQLKLIVTTPATATLLDWEHSKEFELKGEMYDVVYTQTNGDTTRYWCWADHKESSLNKELTQLLDKAMSNRSKKDKKRPLLSFFKSLYSDISETIACAKTSTLLPPFNSTYSWPYTSWCGSVDSPPPWIS